MSHGNKKPHQNAQLVQFSKTLSYLLRHGAEKHNVALSPDGYISLTHLKQPHLPTILRTKTLQDYQELVASDQKNRYSLVFHSQDALPDEPMSGWYIRANQGHSLSHVQVEMQEITLQDVQKDSIQAIHGTFKRHLPSILQQGLSRMQRQHIHCAIGLPGDSGVKSGMRSQCDVFIYIHLEKALKAGIPFYRSSNNVILTPGNQDGYLLPEYFDKVIEKDSS